MNEKIRKTKQTNGCVVIEHTELGSSIVFPNDSAAATWEAAYMLCMSCPDGDDHLCFCEEPPKPKASRVRSHPRSTA